MDNLKADSHFHQETKSYFQTVHVILPLEGSLSSLARHNTKGPLRMSQLRLLVEAVMPPTTVMQTKKQGGDDRLLPLDGL